MQIPFIDLKSQYDSLKSEIDQRIHKVLEHGQYILGPEVAECEKLLAQYVGCKHALTCSSGTDASIIAMMALGVGPGDEVIVPAFSFIATAETALLVGAKPVFVDIDPETYNINPNLIERAITPKTKAIHPVGLYGQPPDMQEINAIAAKHKLAVIEDAAQSFGAIYKAKKSCHLSVIGATSFFPAKPLGCYGDGGAIFTDDDRLAETMAQIRTHGQKERYHHVRIGINGRLDTLQCAILIPKLNKLDWELKQRELLAQRYNQAFEPLIKHGVRLPAIRSDRTTAWAQYTLWVPDRKKFTQKMNEFKVPTSVHYPSTMVDQPAYLHLAPSNIDIRVARECAEHVISLPMHPYMKDEHLHKIVDAVLKSVV